MKNTRKETVPGCRVQMNIRLFMDEKPVVCQLMKRMAPTSVQRATEPAGPVFWIQSVQTTA